MKESIVQYATPIFHQMGIRSVSIETLCSDLRISKKTFYQYFNKKDDLIEAVIQYTQQQHIDKFERCTRDKNAIEVFIQSIREMRKHSDAQPFLFWHDLQKYYPALFKKYDQIKTDAIKKGFEENVRLGIEQGYYRKNLDVEMLSFFHSVQMKHSFETMVQMQMKFSTKRLTDFFTDLMIHLIANEEGLKYVNENLYEKNEKE